MYRIVIVSLKYFRLSLEIHIFYFVGGHSTIHLEVDSDNEELLPPDIIVNESQALLLGLDHPSVPRYMTASPCK